MPQVKGMNVAIRNANDGISLAQIAEGAMAKIGDTLQRMRELAVQAANANATRSSDRTNLDAEFQQLSQEIVGVIDGTKFNGTTSGARSHLLPGRCRERRDRQISLDITDLSGCTGCCRTGGSRWRRVRQRWPRPHRTASTRRSTTVTTARANYGAVQNRFESVISNLR